MTTQSTPVNQVTQTTPVDEVPRTLGDAYPAPQGAKADAVLFPFKVARTVAIALISVGIVALLVYTAHHHGLDKAAIRWLSQDTMIAGKAISNSVLVGVPTGIVAVGASGYLGYRRYRTYREDVEVKKMVEDLYRDAEPSVDMPEKIAEYEQRYGVRSQVV